MDQFQEDLGWKDELKGERMDRTQYQTLFVQIVNI